MLGLERRAQLLPLLRPLRHVVVVHRVIDLLLRGHHPLIVPRVSWVVRLSARLTLTVKATRDGFFLPQNGFSARRRLAKKDTQLPRRSNGKQSCDNMTEFKKEHNGPSHDISDLQQRALY